MAAAAAAGDGVAGGVRRGEAGEAGVEAGGEAAGVEAAEGGGILGGGNDDSIGRLLHCFSQPSNSGVGFVDADREVAIDGDRQRRWRNTQEIRNASMVVV